MFLILKTTDWKEENYIKSNIIPFGWCEDDNRQISNNKKNSCEGSDRGSKRFSA